MKNSWNGEESTTRGFAVPFGDKCMVCINLFVLTGFSNPLFDYLFISLDRITREMEGILMQKETELKNLLDQLSVMQAFKEMEYEGIFEKTEVGYQMLGDMRLFFDGVHFLSISKECLEKEGHLSILELFIQRIYRKPELDIVHLQDSEKLLSELYFKIQLKEERIKRQEASLFRSEKRIQAVSREIPPLRSKAEAEEEKIRKLMKSSKHVKILHQLRLMREQEKNGSRNEE